MPAFEPVPVHVGSTPCFHRPISYEQQNSNTSRPSSFHQVWHPSDKHHGIHLTNTEKHHNTIRMTQGKRPRHSLDQNRRTQHDSHGAKDRIPLSMRSQNSSGSSSRSSSRPSTSIRHFLSLTSRNFVELRTTAVTTAALAAVIVVNGYFFRQYLARKAAGTEGARLLVSVCCVRQSTTSMDPGR